MCRVVIFDCSITPNIPNCLNFNNFFSIFHKISFYLNIPLCLDFIFILKTFYYIAKILNIPLCLDFIPCFYPLIPK